STSSHSHHTPRPTPSPYTTLFRSQFCFYQRSGPYSALLRVPLHLWRCSWMGISQPRGKRMDCESDSYRGITRQRIYRYFNIARRSEAHTSELPSRENVV